MPKRRGGLSCATAEEYEVMTGVQKNSGQAANPGLPGGTHHIPIAIGFSDPNRWPAIKYLIAIRSLGVEYGHQDANREHFGISRRALRNLRVTRQRSKRDQRTQRRGQAGAGEIIPAIEGRNHSENAALELPSSLGGRPRNSTKNGRGEVPSNRTTQDWSPC